MFTIGEFARLGRVSVRMLRHYDAIGLLRPAQVDPSTAYRGYDASQLQRLNRIVALKDLGFTLEQVQTMLDHALSADELRGMLRLRRAELQTQIDADRARLSRVEARLHSIESEEDMHTDDIIVKPLATQRYAELSAFAPSYDDIGPTIQPLYPALTQRLLASGIEPRMPSIAWYEPAPDGEDGVTIHAGFPTDVERCSDPSVAITDLPGVDAAATLVHHGPPESIAAGFQRLDQWVAANGYRPAGSAREIYLDCPFDDMTKWVTELQLPIERVR